MGTEKKGRTQLTQPILLNEQLCFAIYRAQKQYNHFYAKALAPYHLTYPQYISLLDLWEKGSLTVKELGNDLHLDSGTLTPLLKRLEKEGWVNRRRAKEDERRVYISLTAKGKRMKPEVYAHVGDCMTHIGFSQEEYDHLRGEVNEVTTHLADIPDGELV
ncbi:transcriptional regulator [Lactobacillus selangorensis]|uniref:HTH-type transcriptional regulator SarZ n=1 Tax=Lactobacillus selangorensis TaxID=81857 RepID=A0A0R2FUQ8_9LACO|nr:transcriptional regulator [Lactobacillus selangorensis]KRN32000.1 transcriptional regulator [Lactobacillus selangorensis]